MLTDATHRQLQRLRFLLEQALAQAQDPAEDEATYDDPHRYATGVRHVVVNGAPVLRDGEPHGRPGGFVRGRPWSADAN